MFYLTLNNIVTFKSLKVIGNGTVLQIAYELLFGCNCGHILYRYRNKTTWSKNVNSV